MGAVVADVAIIGGGIAGLSLAAALSPYASVVILEQEDDYARHTSGRSAQQMHPAYGPAEIRALTAWTIELVRGFEETMRSPILRPRPLLVGVFDGQNAVLDQLVADVSAVTAISVDDALALLPALRPELLSAAAVDATAKEVDVPGLLAHYVEIARGNGADILFSSPVVSARRSGAGWALRAGDSDVSAGVVVNAAGAWGNAVAELFGKPSPGLTPYRRTVTIARSRGTSLDPDGPMMRDLADSFYFRPHVEGVLASPQEDIASEPMDAVTRLEDVDEVKRRVNHATTLDLGDSVRSWTGLRTQPRDGKPIVGFHPDDPSYFWLVGQGGYGIQTSAAIARIAASTIAGVDAGAPQTARDAFAALAFDPARFVARV